MDAHVEILQGLADHHLVEGKAGAVVYAAPEDFAGLVVWFWWFWWFWWFGGLVVWWFGCLVCWFGGLKPNGRIHKLDIRNNQVRDLVIGKLHHFKFRSDR